MTDDETTYQAPQERKHEGPVRRIIHGIEDIFHDENEDPEPSPEPDHEPSHAQIPRPDRRS